MNQSNNDPVNERFSINVHGGNVQINPDAQNSTIIQSNFSSNYNADELVQLIDAVKKATSSTLNEDEVEIIQNSLVVIEAELSSQEPKKPLLRNAINALKAIKGTVEFSAAVVTLVQFVQTFLPK